MMKQKRLSEKEAPASSTDSISQYDVLLVEKENELEFIPYNHVGNNRLMIFVKMNLQEFIQADNSDLQFQVILNLIDTVNRQCVDVACKRAGKFYKTNYFSPEKLDNTNAWVQPSYDAIGQFLKGLFEREQEEQAKITVEPDDDKKRRRRSSLLRRSLSSGNMIEDQKKRIASRRSILMHLQQFDVSEGESSDDEKDGNQKPNAAMNDEKNVEMTPANPHEDEEEEAKPQAVASKTSVKSKSTGCIVKPKLPTRRLERRSSFDSIPLESSTNVVHAANALDVILEWIGEEYRLQRNHTGNNRLSVMINLRNEKYKEVKDTKIELHRLCLDLVQTVDQHYNGRFLIERKDGKFILFSDEQAAAAICSIFESNSSIATTNIMNSSISSLQSNDSSFSSLPSHLQVTNDVHKAALASLRRRKERQNTNTKISRMINRTHQMLGPRAASVGALDTSEAPPVRVQRRASAGLMLDRRPTLSNFSQELIRDMLLQLDERNGEQLVQQPIPDDLDDLF